MIETYVVGTLLRLLSSHRNAGVYFKPGGVDWNAFRPMWIHSGENDRRLEFHWFVWVRDHFLLLVLTA